MNVTQIIRSRSLHGDVMKDSDMTPPPPPLQNTTNTSIPNVTITVQPTAGVSVPVNYDNVTVSITFSDDPSSSSTGRILLEDSTCTASVGGWIISHAGKDDGSDIMADDHRTASIWYTEAVEQFGTTYYSSSNGGKSLQNRVDQAVEDGYSRRIVQTPTPGIPAYNNPNTSLKIGNGQKKLNLILECGSEVSRFCLNIPHLLRHPYGTAAPSSLTPGWAGIIGGIKIRGDVGNMMLNAFKL